MKLLQLVVAGLLLSVQGVLFSATDFRGRVGKERNPEYVNESYSDDGRKIGKKATRDGEEIVGSENGESESSYPSSVMQSPMRRPVAHVLQFAEDSNLIIYSTLMLAILNSEYSIIRACVDDGYSLKDCNMIELYQIAQQIGVCIDDSIAYYNDLMGISNK